MISEKTKLQYWLKKLSLADKHPVKFMYFKNTDGSIRWIWPASNKSPVFLKFFHASTGKAKIFSLGVRAIYFLKLKNLFFRTEEIPFGNGGIELGPGAKSDWAMFTGTKGPNRKVLLVALVEKNPKEVCVYTKIALGHSSRLLLRNESKQLQYLERLNLDLIQVPRLFTTNNNFIRISGLEKNKTANNLTPTHIDGLIELAYKTKNKGAWSSSKLVKELRDSLDKINRKEDIRIPKGMIRKMGHLQSHLDKKHELDWSFGHGDFTPWNCTTDNQILGMYDLELAAKNLPYGFDAFHFIIQKGILIERKYWKDIWDEIIRDICDPFFNGDLHVTKKYLAYYLYVSVAKGLQLYHNQKDWHIQVNWIMDTWDEALSFVLTDCLTSRQLLLIDVFNKLQNKEQVVLKFKDEIPEMLSSESDVDFCLNKKDACLVIQQLKNHILTKTIRVYNQSFMKSIVITTRDNELLCIDFIWKLMRKNIQFQNIDQLIASGTMNKYGVKQASFRLEMQFIERFYRLNKAQLPERYATNMLPINSQSDWESQIVQHPSNKGVSFLRNTINYGLDIIRRITPRSGLTITFSGVDGAGKTTLIHIVKKKIQKQLRRKVVIIRHRPSFLPIISALRYGKTKAEERSVSQLPRQGQNKSFLSSILRFGYYYFDYIIGQFLIFFKHTMWGTVVLYDRFYFDFINDPERSNIHLPKGFIKLGYMFIFKPKLNFFIYADSKTILKRKKELSKRDIEMLTFSYLNLFLQLDDKKRGKYKSIQNIQLSKCTEEVMNYIKKAAA